MFVQEEKIFTGKVLRLHVCTMEGAEWLEEVPEDTTVEKLKERCLKHVRSRVPVRWEGAASPGRCEPWIVLGWGWKSSSGRAGKFPLWRKLIFPTPCKWLKTR